ncbi:hypothetical protein AZSI13_08780 [Azospira sp. I13]|uniref:hypothetical protein n=1 Tax=Azospira sp. I13 TaxID=1765050 RepID=UPI000D47A6D0|nr:hypothetical protein [Azospira sp. I13]GBG01551.1 hypothetical protein AZSI13_08780 [Azospira sp. I13]
MNLDLSQHLSSHGERGLAAALVFALVAERLNGFYEHGVWLTDAQGATLAAEWLGRSKRSLPLAERKRLSSLSGDLAQGIAASLSREAGLHTTHEMMEALDPNYHSDTGLLMMAQCVALLEAQEGE